jgi:hypothetical protein
VWLRRGGLLLVMALVVEYAVLPQLAGARSALTLLSSVSPGFLAAGIVLELASLGAYSALTRAVLPAAGRPSLWTLLRVDVSALGLSHLVPGGGATSNGLRYRLLTVAGMAPGDVVTAAALQTAGAAAMLAVVFTAGVALALPGGGDTPAFLVVDGVAVAVLVLAAVCVVGLVRRPAAVVGWARRGARVVPRLDPAAAAGVVGRLADRLTALGADRAVLRRALGWACANWLFDAAALWVFLRAFGPVDGLKGLLLGYGLAGLVALLPLTPGGLGTVEATLISVLVGFGTPHAHAVLGVITWRLAEFWLPIPLAAAAYVSLRTGVLRPHRLPARPLVPGADGDPARPAPARLNQAARRRR